MYENALMTRREVEYYVRLSRASIYSLMRKHRFPTPIKVGAQAVRWRGSEIDEWLEARPRATGEIKIVQKP